GRSRAALAEAAEREGDEQATSLQLAKTHLHQAHGALQMVDVEGVGLITAAAEKAIDRFKDASLACTPEHSDVVGVAYLALTEYLEELLAGAMPQPARLFPYYRALQEMLGAERIHPADLFFIDLSVQVTLREHSAPPTAPDFALVRSLFEKSLLPFLKSADTASQRQHAAGLQQAIAPLVEAQRERHARTFWMAMQSFAELVASGQLASDLYVKQLFGLINLQIRRLSQGQGSLPEQMLRDALFFIAAAPVAPPGAMALRRAYQLDGMVPSDYDSRRYGRIDAEALKTAKDALAQTKTGWDKLATETDSTLEADFKESLASLTAASDKLGAPALAQLLRELGQAAGASIASGRNDQLGLEMATAMLFVEHGLEQVRQLPAHFDEHAEVIGARLLALAAGETPPDAPQWQGDLSRQIQQGQTVAVLAGEMKTGLRQVEKVLDDYYADHGKRAALSQIDPVLHQLQGALAILDQEHAMRAAQHVKQAVALLAATAGDEKADAASLQNIAQNIGALGFFIDMLAQNFEAAKRRFAFDQIAGMFGEVPFEKAVAGAPLFDVEPEPVAPVEMPAPAPVAKPAPVPPAAAGEDAIEAELLEIFISEAQEVLAFVSATLPAAQAQPSNQDTLTMLRRSFHTLKGSGRMVGLEKFADVGAAIEKVMNMWLAEARAASPDLLALLGHATTEMTAWVDQLASAGASSRNGEALVAAAQRVQAGGAFTVDAEHEQLGAAPAAGPSQAQLEAEAQARAAAEAEAAAKARAEAQALAEAQAKAEAEAKARAQEQAEAEARAQAEAEARAQALREAQAKADAEARAEAEAQAALEAQLLAEERQLAEELRLAHEREQAEAEARAAEGEMIEMSLPVGDDELEDEPELSLAAPAGNVIEFPVAAPRVVPEDDNTKRIGEIEIPLPLYNIYLAETDEIMRVLTRDFSEWRHEAKRAVTPEALKAAHTLAGTSATVGFKALREVAYALEMVLKVLAPPTPMLTPAQRDLLDNALECARQMLQSFALGELPPPRPELVAELNAMREQVPAVSASESFDTIDPALAPHLDHLFAATLESLRDEAAPAFDQRHDAPAEAAAGDPVIEAIDAHFDVEFDDAFDQAFEAPSLTPATPPSTPLVEDDDIEAQLVPELISSSEEPLQEAAPEEEISLAASPAPVLEAAPVTLAEAVPAPEPEAVAIETQISDELDADLLPIFIEEATDMLPEIGNGLRKWQQNPSDTGPAQNLLRTLHTVKGSARMAGAMRLGQHTHDIETQIENMVHAGTSTPAAFDDLLANYDHALLLFEQLQNPAAAVPSAAPAPVAGSAAAVAASAPGVKPQEEAAGAQARVPLVRVRADILDRLVNQAGEVSISRSKLENQVSVLRSSLFDFSDNLDRLRRQLREVEMQAESQIASRMSISSEREFDPLEFDRFTRLQELTRMMAESVNDVASFHESLGRTIEGATADLTVQSRLTRDLQRDLMRVRMVPFSSLSERLFRVARQTAKEIDKRVNLDIRGGAVEIDRSVLEQMAAPFEHLLRNAIVHGIETRERRGASGKAETGELLVQVSQQGNEVVIQFTDDGAGLDLNRIRAKAVSNGLIDANAQLSDNEAAELIFEPGFSTAEALTELAGRGVGMDVVRSEAQALGGRVAIKSEFGAGARFTIHLPLTLAVTQVVLTTTGDKTFAMPSILVEQVLQMKEGPLQKAHAAGHVEYQGQAVALHYLPNLLGDPEARPITQRSCPVMILKSGTDRLAVQVDDVVGNREVVIKNIGPQLSRMIGISGATVLGSGEIVLILNPVALSLHMDHHPQLRPQAKVAPVVAPEMRARDFVIMVVDDSLTVRRVTERLLTREGYQVMLAKDGVDALEQLQETIPALMMVDIEMPRMDGFDLTRNIRGNDSTKAVPIIMITSRTADKHRNYALDLGVNAYFGKPFQEDRILAAIAGLLNRKMPA
ncbi:MAG: Hpt domain-containing protein, partial [Massilia sp.]